ncbi:unnamed protein product [Dicrocoelium dendriticum]|nr:unnamed protein product [Dicrocoelium dendriticum]
MHSLKVSALLVALVIALSRWSYSSSPGYVANPDEYDDNNWYTCDYLLEVVEEDGEDEFDDGVVVACEYVVSDYNDAMRGGNMSGLPVELRQRYYI